MHAYLRFTQKAFPQASVLLLIVAAVAAPAMATPLEAFRLDHPGTGPFPRFGTVVEIEGNRMLVTAPGAKHSGISTFTLGVSRSNLSK